MKMIGSRLTWALTAGLVIGASAVSSRTERSPWDKDAFMAFATLHGRTYTPGSPEFEERYAIFAKRAKEVAEHNARPNKTWVAALNAFADRTDRERKAMLGYKRIGSDDRDRGGGGDLGVAALSERMKVPEAKDWSHLALTKQVANQLSCGSCWAFTTTAVLDAHYEIVNGKLPASLFSPQELLDCVPNDQQCGGTGGCGGATVELGLNYVLKKGLRDLAQVPYQGVDGSCAQLPADSSQMTFQKGSGQDQNLGLLLVGLRSYTNLTKNREEDLLLAMQDGPVAISVAANNWFSYESGIYNGCRNGTLASKVNEAEFVDNDNVVNHAVVLFGYAKDYWTIRNSWGPEWGEQGYIRVARTPGQGLGGDHESCTIDTNNQEGVGCQGDPKNVTVCGPCGMFYDSVAVQMTAAAKAEKDEDDNSEQVTVMSDMNPHRLPLVEKLMMRKEVTSKFTEGEV